MDEGPLRDPEFRPIPADRPILTDPGSAEPEAYQRLVANPFLAAAAWILWLPATAWLIGWMGRTNPPNPRLEAPLAFLLLGAILLIPAGFVAPFWLLHYHCLDCGATGRIARWRRHSCPTVRSRVNSGRPRRLRGPTPPTQVILWLWFVLMACIALGSIRR